MVPSNRVKQSSSPQFQDTRAQINIRGNNKFPQSIFRPMQPDICRTNSQRDSPLSFPHVQPQMEPITLLFAFCCKKNVEQFKNTKTP